MLNKSPITLRPKDNRLPVLEGVDESLLVEKLMSPELAYFGSRLVSDATVRSFGVLLSVSESSSSSSSLQYKNEN